MTGGPARKPTKLNVAKVAKPAAGGIPGTRIEALYRMGAPSEQPTPSNAKPIRAVAG